MNILRKAKSGFIKWKTWIIETGEIPHTDISCRSYKFGSHYGGYKIATDYINSKSIIYSFGIGKDISFDKQLVERFNCKIHLFDPTPDSIDWVKSQNLDARFILHEFGLSASNGTINFFPPVNQQFISHSAISNKETGEIPLQVQVKNIDTIMHELFHQSIDVLKMDIEGMEYTVIENLINSNIRPGQILLEFHHHFPEINVIQTKNTINSLRSAGYSLFSYSIALEEFSFIYNQIIKKN